MRLYQIPGAKKEDVQTVVTFLSSMDNPDNECKKECMHVDELLSEALDKVLISDRVRSCNDFYRTNNKRDVNSSNSMQVYSKESI